MSQMIAIPESVLEEGYFDPVHVEGWNRASMFTHVWTDRGVHVLKTTRGKIYKTKNRLLYARNYEPE